MSKRRLILEDQVIDRICVMQTLNICEQAEAFRLLLLMRVVSKSEIITWADNVIATHDNVPGWLLDISLAANEDDGQIESTLRDLPCEGNQQKAAYSAIERFGEIFRSKRVQPVDAAHMLERWAASSKPNRDDYVLAMVPRWLTDELEFGYASEQEVVESVEQCLDDFSALRQAR